MSRTTWCFLVLGIATCSSAIVYGVDPVKKAAVPAAKDGKESKSTDVPPADKAPDVTPAVRTAEETFSASLFKALTPSVKAGASKVEGASNLVISPYGVYEALSMLRSGAGGTTRTALEQLLGTTVDDAQLARALNSLRSAGNPYVLQLGVPISDNDGYGVKIVAAPAKDSLLTQAGIGEGDLVFSVDGIVVRKASELLKECATSTGQVRLNGFSFSSGEAFADKAVQLTRVRQLGSAPDRQILNVANALLVDPRLKVNSQFSTQLESLYKAPTFSGDFSKFASLEALASAHFAEATGGRMTQVRLPKQASSDTVLLLMNVLAMEAQWQRRFPPATAGKFHAPEGDIAAQMMRQTSAFRLAEMPGLQILELPYRDSSLTMWVLLPSEANGWQTLDLAPLLAPKSLSQIRSTMKSGQVEVELPKFRITRDESLKGVLSTLGLSELFTDKANFEVLATSNNVLLEDVRQQVFIEVNEQGTRAGAVTQAIGAVKSLKPQNLRQFHADHPFYFLIRDEQGGVYFVGRVLSPVAPAPADVPKTNTAP